MVKEFYGGMGYTKTAEDAEGNTTWTLDVQSYSFKQPPMAIER